jgi:hypothetical protein
MKDEVTLALTQQFELERMNRLIDTTVDPEQLQVIAKQLLHAWQSQRAATDWVSRQLNAGF